MFGILVLFAIVFVISFVNYWWGTYKNKEESNDIAKFIKKFEIVSDEDAFKNLLKNHNIPIESLVLLAHTYSKSGDFEKSIGLYLLALERTSTRDEKKYILSELGKTYFKAGFLRRSEDVFIESLKLHPRNEESLKYLSVTYEKLKEYERAIEVLDSLEELGAKVDKQRDYLKALSILHNYKLSDSKKMKELILLYKSSKFLDRMVFEFALNTSYEIDKELFEDFSYENFLDLLWYADIDWFASKTFSLLKEVASARGFIEPIDNYKYFELETLAKLQSIGYKKASLNFEYICKDCKQNFPVHFYRCPNCQAIATTQIEPIITKNSYEENISFQ
jgi:lipopolysaccharide biosynthesis regulator YciM